MDGDVVRASHRLCADDGDVVRRNFADFDARVGAGEEGDVVFVIGGAADLHMAGDINRLESRNDRVWHNFRRDKRLRLRLDNMRFAGHGNDEEAGGRSRDIDAAVAEGDAGGAVAARRFGLCFWIISQGLWQEGVAKRFRGGTVCDVQREETVEGVDGEDIIVADADGPEVVAEMI